jgi:cation diffusion facilitator CzcD-associated flavoprotein CzcO
VVYVRSHQFITVHHQHTPWHGLPHDSQMSQLKFPIFKTKNEVVDYLTSYASMYNINNNVSFNNEVVKVERRKTSELEANEYDWVVHTNRGDVINAKFLVICTGLYANPNKVILEGQEQFQGEIKHSWEMKNCSALKGKRVLVVGSGNSACECAVDCVHHEAQDVDLLVFSPRLFLRKPQLERFHNFSKLIYIYICIYILCNS